MAVLANAELSFERGIVQGTEQDVSTIVGKLALLVVYGSAIAIPFVLRTSKINRFLIFWTIGTFIAYTQAGYEFLGRWLTEARMAEFLLPLRPREVRRYALPGIRAYNFLARDILDGGASRSLRIDSQGKTLALAVLEMQIPPPPNIDEMR